MKHIVRVAGILCLVMAVSSSLFAAANKWQVTVTPSTIPSLVDSNHPMTVCVSGFDRGDIASVLVPWKGTPETHTALAHQGTVDDSGSWCFNTPPSWTTLELSAGTYTINVYGYPHGDLSRSRRGPTATFDVR